MPLYDFKNLTSGEVYTKMMSIADMEEYVKDENVQQVLSAPKLISSAKCTLRTAGYGWKEVQDKIKSGLTPRLRDKITPK